MKNVVDAEGCFELETGNRVFVVFPRSKTMFFSRRFGLTEEKIENKYLGRFFPCWFSF